MNDFLRYLFLPVRLVIAAILIVLMTIVFLIGSAIMPHFWKDYSEAVSSIGRFVINGMDSY